MQETLLSLLKKFPLPHLHTQKDSLPFSSFLSLLMHLFYLWKVIFFSSFYRLFILIINWILVHTNVFFFFFWLKITKIYSPTVLEDKSLKLRHHWGHVISGASREEYFLPSFQQLPAVLSIPWLVAAWSQFLPPSSCDCLPSVCQSLCSDFLLLIRTPVIGLWLTPLSMISS